MNGSPVSQESPAVNPENYLSHFDGKLLFFIAYENEEELDDKPKPQHLLGKFSDLEKKLTQVNEKGWGVFLTVNEMVGRRRTKNDIVRCRAIWIDDDVIRDGPRTDFPIPPNLVVNTSPGKYHYYWLTSTTEFDEWNGVMATMVKDWGCDNSAKDLARVLRLPGFNHVKGDPNPVTFEVIREEPYSWDEIKEAFPPLVTEDAKGNTTYGDKKSQDECLESIITGEDFHRSFQSIISNHANNTSNRETLIALAKGVGYQALLTGRLSDSRAERLTHMLSSDSIEIQEMAQWAIDSTEAEKQAKLNNITQLHRADLIVEEFPLHLLPKDMHVAVKEAARALKVREEVVAIIYLSFTMIAMGTGITIYEKSYHLLHASVGFIGVLAPGERKSGIFNVLLRHFDKCKDYMLDQWKIEKSKIDSKNKLLGKQIKKLNSETPEMDAPEFDEWRNKIAILEAQIEDAPERPVIYVDDATEESVTNQLVDNGGGIGVISPDARAIVANILGQYKKGNQKGEGVFIKGISGDPISKLRVTTGHGHVSCGCLNLLGLVQKDSAQKLLSDVAMTGSGLLGRIFFISPTSLVGTRIEEKDELPFQSDKLAAMDNVIRRAFMCRNFDLRLSEEAAEQRRLYHNKIELEMGAGGIYEEDSEITNKMCSVATKVAAAFYSIEHPEKLQTDGNGNIEDELFKNASRLVDYLMKQNLYVVKKQKGNDITNTAEKILKAAKANHNPETYYTSGIFKSTHISDKWKIYFESALELLIANKLIEFNVKSGGKTILFRLTDRGLAYVDKYL